LEAKTPSEINQKNPNTANHFLLPAPLFIFDHIGREKQMVLTLLKETELEKYSPGGQTTFQEGCQRQTTAASLIALLCALQQSTKLDFNSISKQNKNHYFFGI